MISEHPKFSPVPLDLLDEQSSVSALIRQASPEALDFEAVRKRVGDAMGRWLACGYSLGRETLKRFRLDDWAPSSDTLSQYVPTMEQVMYRFTDEDLSVLPEYQKPTIVIRPPRKGQKELMAALARHYQAAQTGPMVTELHSMDWGQDNEFRPFIVEGPCNMTPKHDILSQALAGRMWRRAQIRRTGEYAMTSELYLLLAMQSIVREQIIDQKTFTILEGNPVVADRYVGRGQCLNGRPLVDWVPIDDADSVRGRFRRVLRGSNG